MQFRNYFLSMVAPDDLAALEPHLQKVELTQNQPLHEPGERTKQVYFPSNAVISIITTISDGRGVESMTIGHESVVALTSALSGETIHSRILVQIPGSAIRLSAAKLRERATESQPFMRLLLRHLDTNIVQAQQGVACNALHDAAPRLARWLLMTQDRTDGDVLLLTQEMLAMMVGVQRTTVTSAAIELKAAGLIDYRRGMIRILDRKGLERRACECYDVLRERSRELLASQA